ncbi:MAG: DUF2269 domain-containing protein [Agarilytica sp.]
MNTYFTVKTLHILSATILFGTGIGIAFFMLRSYFSNDLKEKFYASKNTVLADYIFTFPAAILQPLTGAWLVWISGIDWMSLWLVATYVIYLIAGLCWVPVVWIQIQLKSMVHVSLDKNIELPERYYRLFRLWFLLGWPAFIGLVIVFFLMVKKPT